MAVPQGGFALLSHTPQNASLVHAVTFLAFDPFEELLWSGNNGVIFFFFVILDFLIISNR